MKNIIARALIVGGIAIGVIGVKAQTADPSQATPELTVEGVAARVATSELAVIARMRALQPIVEVYIQNMDEKLGTIPTRDEYFLGQFRWNDTSGPQLLPLAPERGNLQH
jgi:hypothetical protein